jgi:hypothetical protein
VDKELNAVIGLIPARDEIAGVGDEVRTGLQRNAFFFTTSTRDCDLM